MKHIKDRDLFIENLAEHVVENASFDTLQAIAIENLMDTYDNLTDEDLLQEAEYAGFENFEME